MHRLGFTPDEIPELIERLKKQTAVIPRSVFSHLVGSDAEQFDSFTRRQIEAFERASQELQEAFPHKILRHICNTAGMAIEDRKKVDDWKRYVFPHPTVGEIFREL